MAGIAELELQFVDRLVGERGGDDGHVVLRAGAARRLTRGSGKSLVALPSLSLTSLARAVGC